MSNLSDSLPNRQIDEYRVEQLLGAGGMARVYRALDTRLQRYVALKVIAPDFRTDADYAERFAREAQSIGRLEHRNIVHIYRFGEFNGLYYMAMEYIQGADLGWLISDYKHSGETMPIDSIARVLQDIGGALDYAHKRGVIHRDVKPGNIVLDKSGRAVLTDFGLALLSDVGTRGEIFGSPHYISPEQAVSSSNVVPQSDQYSLGVTLFEMLTGEVPFPGDQPMDVAMRHVTDQPPAPSSINKAITPAVDAVVLKALEKEPAHRYDNNVEFAAAFQQAIKNSAAEPAFSVSDTIRRPSLIAVPAKVEEHMAAAPLPPLPPALQAPVQGRIEATTPRAQRYSQPQEVTADARRWLYPVMFAVGIFSIGVIALLVVLIGRRPASPIAAISTPTTTADPLNVAEMTIDPSATSAPSLTSTSLPTAIPITILPTNTPLPTLVPSNTPTEIPLIVIATTLVPTSSAVAVPTKTPLPLFTPSPTTLRIEGSKEWVAFVNVSDGVLSLVNFQLIQDDRQLTAEAWNKSRLLPGECLRIYRNEPKENPPNCRKVNDLPGKKDEREKWIDKKTVVVLSDSIQLCYPAEKCGNKDK